MVALALQTEWLKQQGLGRASPREQPLPNALNVTVPNLGKTKI